MEFISTFSFSDAIYFFVKLIVVLVSFGLFVFSFLVSRQIQLMNRVLTTQLAGVFQGIGFLFIILTGFVFGLTVLGIFL